MTKKDYQKPTIKVVLLQHKCQILAGSGPETLSGSKGDTPEEDTWYDLE